MRFIFLYAVFALCSSAAYSQGQQASHEIIAQGSAKMKVSPDIAAFRFTVEKNDTSEKRAINKLNIAIQSLQKALNAIGLPDSIFRIAQYQVTSYFNEQVRKKTYTATNTLKLEFQISNRSIDGILGQIQNAGIQDLDIDFSSKLSDSLEKTTRLKLVAMAIDDAKTNALNIASALDIKLGRVTQVQKIAGGPILYKIETSKFTPAIIDGQSDFRNVRSSFDKCDLEEIELEEEITVIYAISNS